MAAAAGYPVAIGPRADCRQIKGIRADCRAEWIYAPTVQTGLQESERSGMKRSWAGSTAERADKYKKAAVKQEEQLHAG